MRFLHLRSSICMSDLAFFNSVLNFKSSRSTLLYLFPNIDNIRESRDFKSFGILFNRKELKSSTILCLTLIISGSPNFPEVHGIGSSSVFSTDLSKFNSTFNIASPIPPPSCLLFNTDLKFTITPQPKSTSESGFPCTISLTVSGLTFSSIINMTIPLSSKPRLPARPDICIYSPDVIYNNI
ncbi:hypothetical protein AGLY_004424 [Aphis glycines]|uniref:Uncharacterized protein n=1 Tax=Aphis glycines TaxID=307491 RepID=A0A6G0TY05_APHGL|nr:hypothetical protein AGLY_004424 [Aphis glycines]